ncbi:hypothetical protein J3459_010640 [Metarhizium acridum]|nr:hypothetical protein J3459_010640 [Metarhizium acridum]
MALENLAWQIRACSRLAVFKSIKKRQFRFVSISVFISLCLIIYLLIVYLRSGPRTWTVETVVHQKDTKISHNPQYSLTPFPASPLEGGHDTSSDQRVRRPWLAAVICAAQDVERRMLIRSTWMRLFRHIPFDARFVVSNPGPRWNEIVRFENRTFGDLIVLDHIPEDDMTANTIKTLELYKWLINHGSKYEFVTKLDTDVWINAPAFWERYLVPRLSNKSGHTAAAVNRTVIGQLYFSDSGYNTFAHGSMYTITWDMVQLLVSLQERFNVLTGEDAAVGILMHKGSQTANFVNFRGEEKFDYDDSDAREHDFAWARAGTHPNAISHAVYGSNVIAVHKLKDNRLWMKVAKCFNQRGIKPMPPLQRPERRLSLGTRWNDWMHSIGLSRSYVSMMETIPKELIAYDTDHWVCDGIWNLGGSRQGFNTYVAHANVV